YDDFWPYAYDDIYYGIYGPYAYGGPYGYRPYGDPTRYYAGRSARRGVSSGRYAARANGTEPGAAEVCSDDAAQLTNWPIERISEVVQPTTANALDELRAASAKAVDMLKSGCPNDLPSIPTGRLAAMESRLQVMLAAVQTVRPALERFYQSLSDEQKARFNAIAPTNDAAAAGRAQRDLTKWRAEKVCRGEAAGPPGPADRSHWPSGPAHAGAAHQPRRIEGCVRQGRGTAQNRMPSLPNAHPDRSGRGDGGAPRGHACRNEDGS